MATSVGYGDRSISKRCVLNSCGISQTSARVRLSLYENCPSDDRSRASVSRAEKPRSIHFRPHAWTAASSRLSALIGENPNDGVLEIFGRDGGTARVAIFDETSVDVQVDANADNNYESSTNMSWDQFLGLAPL